MANAAWPGTLPAFLMEQGFGESMADQSIETAMESGLSKVRRRYTTANRAITGAIVMNVTQRAAFEAFFDTTLRGGSLPFDWVHPVYQTAATFRFRKPVPKWSVRGNAHIVAFALEKIA